MKRKGYEDLDDSAIISMEEQEIRDRQMQEQENRQQQLQQIQDDQTQSSLGEEEEEQPKYQQDLHEAYHTHCRPHQKEQKKTSSFRRLFSLSDPNLYNRPQLNNRISLGSICLVRPHAQNTGNDATQSTDLPSWSFFRGKGRTLLGVFIMIYVVYMCLGAIGFRIIERPVEMEERNSIWLLRTQFREKYPMINDDDLEEFLKAVITANDRGISPLRNATNDMNWSFGQALFFSSTVITTIGYGHVTPLSQTGKIFCMIYAAIGIPLTLVLLSAMVEKLLVPANWLLGLLNSKLGHLYQPFNIRVMHLSIVMLIVATIFFAIPTTIFTILEPSWGILDAFYYCFISLTTIGLGDYIPGEGVSIDNRSLYKMCITAYLVCGLISMMLVLTIFYDIPQLNLGQLFTESVNGETEKLRLAANQNTCYSGPSGLYMPQRNEDTRRAVVRIRPHDDGDSPSPDEAPSSSSQSKDMRMP